MNWKKQILWICLFCAACASRSPRPQTEAIKGLPPALESLALSYKRGNNSYKFQVERKDQHVFARSYADQSLILEKKLTKEELGSLQSLVENIFQQNSPEKEPIQLFRCRTPFELEMLLGQEKKKLSGCRSSGVGPLVNEFLHEADIMLLQVE